MDKLVIRPEDFYEIKQYAYKYFDETLPRGFDERELQLFMLARGFVDYLKTKSVDVPVEFENDTDRRGRPIKKLPKW